MEEEEIIVIKFDILFLIYRDVVTQKEEKNITF